MARFAASVRPDLLDAIDRLASKPLPIAEVCRCVGAEAARLGLAQPSYERVRILVHASRERRRLPTTADVVLDVAFRVRPPDALLDHVAGTTPRRRPR